MWCSQVCGLHPRLSCEQEWTASSCKPAATGGRACATSVEQCYSNLDGKLYSRVRNGVPNLELQKALQGYATPRRYGGSKPEHSWLAAAAKGCASNRGSRGGGRREPGRWQEGLGSAAGETRVGGREPGRRQQGAGSAAAGCWASRSCGRSGELCRLRQGAVPAAATRISGGFDKGQQRWI